MSITKMFGVKSVHYLEQEPATKKTKNVTLFDYVNDIMKHKRGNVHDNDPLLKEFNAYMVLQFLSLHEVYVHFLPEIEPYIHTMDKLSQYKLLLAFIPRHSGFVPYPKKKSGSVPRKVISMFVNYLQCGVHEVEELFELRILDNKSIKQLENMYGGKM